MRKGALALFGFESIEVVTMVTALIAAISSISVALIQRKERDAREEVQKATEAYRANQAVLDAQRDEREKERHHMNEAMYEGIYASLDALEVSLIAIKGGSLNGNVEDALHDIGEARKSFDRTRNKVVSNML